MCPCMEKHIEKPKGKVQEFGMEWIVISCAFYIIIFFQWLGWKYV